MARASAMRRGSKGSPPPGSGRLLRTPSFSGRILPPKKTKVRVGPGSRGSQRFADCALSLSPMPRRKWEFFDLDNVAQIQRSTRRLELTA